MDQKKYMKEGGEEYANKYNADNPYYGGVKHEMKDGTKKEQATTTHDFWTADEFEKEVKKTNHPTQEEIIAYNRLQEAVRLRKEEKEEEELMCPMMYM